MGVPSHIARHEDRVQFDSLTLVGRKGSLAEADTLASHSPTTPLRLDCPSTSMTTEVATQCYCLQQSELIEQATSVLRPHPEHCNHCRHRPGAPRKVRCRAWTRRPRPPRRSRRLRRAKSVCNTMPICRTLGPRTIICSTSSTWRDNSNGNSIWNRGGDDTPSILLRHTSR